MNLNVLHTIYASGGAISHICLSLCEHMQSPDIHVRLMVPGAYPQARRPFLRAAVPRAFQPVVFRIWRTEEQLRDLTARRFVRTLRRQDVIYLWPGSPLWLYQLAKERGHTVVMERINCHRATARRILDEGYQRAGLAPNHGLTEEETVLETRKLALADWVFSPAPNVERSLVDAGMPSGKILRASYGWDPSRIRPGEAAPRPYDGLVVLFLGRICIRKGAHLLLDAWAKADVRGTLLLAGRLDAEVAALCREQLARPDVKHLPYAWDVAPYFAAADLFAFPTLEEGSPLVVYEALGAGLPILTTLMGGGEVVRDGLEGWIREAYDADAWVTVLRALARDRDSLRTLSTAARERAALFTWERAGRHRAGLLRAALAPPAGARPPAGGGSS